MPKALDFRRRGLCSRMAEGWSRCRVEAGAGRVTNGDDCTARTKGGRMVNPQNALLFPTVTPTAFHVDAWVGAWLIPCRPFTYPRRPSSSLRCPSSSPRCPFALPRRRPASSYRHPAGISSTSRRHHTPILLFSPLPLVGTHHVAVRASRACRASALTCST